MKCHLEIILKPNIVYLRNLGSQHDCLRIFFRSKFGILEKSDILFIAVVDFQKKPFASHREKIRISELVERGYFFVTIPKNPALLLTICLSKRLKKLVAIPLNETLDALSNECYRIGV